MFKPSIYFKNILTLMSGVLLSQIILFFGSLLLTRIFSPEDFGLAALFLSIVNIFTVISTFRYEHSLVLPVSDIDAFDIMSITRKIILFFCVVIFVGVIIFGNVVTSFFSKTELNFWLYFLPLMILVNAFFSIYRSWLVRVKKFKRISVGALIKSSSLTACLIIGGLLFKNVLVFLFANIVGQLLETVYLHYAIKGKESSFGNGKAQLKKYINFPKFSLPADLISVYSSQNPILLFSVFFGDYVVGQFSLTQRVLAIPIKFISGSTLEVYKQKASEDYNNYGNCLKIFKSTFKSLFLIGIIPTGIMFFFAPILFEILFGSEWRDAGIFAKYLLMMFFLQFSISPLSYTLYIAGKQNYNLYWQIMLLITTSIGIFMGVLNNSVDISIIGFSIAYSFMYIVYLVMIYYSAKGYVKK